MLGDFLQPHARGLAVSPKSIVSGVRRADNIRELGQPPVRGKILRVSVPRPDQRKSLKSLRS